MYVNLVQKFFNSNPGVGTVPSSLRQSELRFGVGALQPTASSMWLGLGGLGIGGLVVYVSGFRD